MNEVCGHLSDFNTMILVHRTGNSVSRTPFEFKNSGRQQGLIVLGRTLTRAKTRLTRKRADQLWLENNL
jgi:hypothetical protein